MSENISRKPSESRELTVEHEKQEVKLLKSKKIYTEANSKRLDHIRRRLRIRSTN